jgi:hypothetical protein
MNYGAWFGRDVSASGLTNLRAKATFGRIAKQKDSRSSFLIFCRLRGTVIKNAPGQR